MRALIAALGREAVNNVEQIVARNSGLGHRPSILHDMSVRQPTELEALYGVQPELAKLTGTPMPTLELLAALIRAKVQA